MQHTHGQAITAPTTAGLAHTYTLHSQHLPHPSSHPHQATPHLQQQLEAAPLICNTTRRSKQPSMYNQAKQAASTHTTLPAVLWVCAVRRRLLLPDQSDSLQHTLSHAMAWQCHWSKIHSIKHEQAVTKDYTTAASNKHTCKLSRAAHTSHMARRHTSLSAGSRHAGGNNNS